MLDYTNFGVGMVDLNVHPTADNAIHWINLYPVNNEIGFQNIFAPDSRWIVIYPVNSTF